SSFGSGTGPAGWAAASGSGNIGCGSGDMIGAGEASFLAALCGAVLILSSARAAGVLGSAAKGEDSTAGSGVCAREGGGDCGAALGTGVTRVGEAFDGFAPRPIHCPERITTPRDFSAGLTAQAYAFASMPFGKSSRKHSRPSAIRRFATTSAPRSPAS